MPVPVPFSARRDPPAVRSAAAPRAPWRMGLRPLAVALALLLPVATHAAGTAGTPGPAVVVPVLTLQAGSAVQGFTLEGRVTPQRQATVAAQVPGTVARLAVAAGDSVRAGQVLAQIDARETEAGVQRAAAALAQAQAEAGQVRLQTQRTAELRTQGFVSAAALDAARAQLQGAEAAVRQSEAARAQAALARGFATVTAPFDGLVLATHLDAGDLAAPGRAVLTLYAPGAMRVDVALPASRAAAARAAQQVWVQLPDGREVVPLRRTLLAAADPVSQTLEWRLELPAEAVTALAPGQALRVRVESAPDAVRAAAGAAGAVGASGAAPLSLPLAAVLRRGELEAVYVAREGGFSLRAVRLGAVQGGRVEVLAGLRSGEQVAADALRAGLAGARPAR